VQGSALVRLSPFSNKLIGSADGEAFIGWSDDRLKQTNSLGGCQPPKWAPTPPTYLESSQELSYQLAAPHFNTSNEEFKGTYSLVVSEKLAHCIWGKSLTNASARVTILSADGKSSVVTQTLKETSGFYYFNINGFGFSAPTIRIKLTQNVADAKPVPASIPSPVSRLASTFKVSITCTKGKITKKVTGVSPKCPTGYKKV
jgi:hypothetical protein